MPTRGGASAYPWRYVADGIRVATLISAVIALIWIDILSALGFAVVFVSLLVPRFAHLAGPFDAG